MKQSKKGGFLMQAGILAAAGIIVRIIGILYRSPLVAIIGDEGNGYYNTAYNIYTIILLISSYSIPSAISKVIAARLALHEYKNAHRILICSFYYVIVVGGIGSLFCYFGAGWLVGKNSAMVLKVFAPTIFLSGLLGVLRGYFQAHRTMVQTSLSQIIEQIMNAVVSILAAYLLMKTVAQADSTTQAVYGAIGSALGTGSGVLIALMFMGLLYLVNKEFFHKRMMRDHTESVLSYRQIFGIIIAMVTPVVLSTFIYNLNTASNLKIYQEVMQLYKGYTEEQATTSYGLFSGKAMQIINIPIAIASAMSAAVIPTISASYEIRNYQDTQKKVAQAIKVTMLISIPSGIGLFVLARPVVMLLYPQRATVDTVVSLIRILSITVWFYGLSTLSNAILQGIGKVNRPVIHAAVSWLFQSALLLVCLFFTDWNLYSMCAATISYSFLMCLFNALSIRKCLGYRQEVRKTFVLPILSSFWMGIAAGGVYYGIAWCFRMSAKDDKMEIAGMKNVICLIPALVVAVLVYFVLILKSGAIAKKELNNMPKGVLLSRIAQRLHIIK